MSIESIKIKIMSRPLFSKNATTEDKIVGTLGLITIYGFLIYQAIKFLASK